MNKLLLFLIYLFATSSFANESNNNDITSPVQRYCPPLVYPINAINQGLGGLVVIKSVISEQGMVVSSSTVLEGADKSLVNVALEHFQKCSFEPFDKKIDHDNFAIKTYKWTWNSDAVSTSNSNIFRYKKGCRKPDYPSASRRAEEQGSVIMKYKLDLDGYVSEIKLDKSSGFIRLDEAAMLSLVGCKFKAPDDNSDWKSLTYSWRLK